MRRFRRRNNGAWLPVNPTFLGEDTNGRSYYETFITFGLQPAEGDGQFFAIPLTLDDTQTEQQNPGQSLSDYVQGQEYLLDRVVGKIWAGLIQSPEAAGYRVLAAAGIAVLPTAPQSNSPALEGNEWNPLLANNMQEPWLWRRTWVLNNNFRTDVDQYIFPTSTAEYGSVLDGGHVDTKGGKRRITREHRLYIVFGGEILAASTATAEVSTEMRMGYDLRLHGAMRRARNRSSF